MSADDRSDVDDVIFVDESADDCPKPAQPSVDSSTTVAVSRVTAPTPRTPIGRMPASSLATPAITVSPALAGLGVFAFLALPPGLLGNNHLLPTLALGLGTIILLLISARLDPRRLLPAPALWAFAGFHLYLVAVHQVLEPGTIMISLTSMLPGMLGIALVTVMLACCRLRDLVLMLVLIHAIMAASHICTWVIDLLLPGAAPVLGRFLIRGYFDAWVTWRFPCSLFYEQAYAIGDLTVMRAMGMYREPGLYQAFGIAVAALAWISPFRHRRWISGLLFVGSFASISTAWLASAMAAIGWLIVTGLRPNRLASVLQAGVLVAGLAAVALIARDLPAFGFADKLDGDSGQDRVQALRDLLPALTESPWIGLGQATELQGAYIESATGSFAVGMARIGLIGTLLVGFAVVLALLRAHDRRSLVVVIPILLTTLTSQPLYYSALPLLFLVLPLRDLRDQWLSDLPAVPISSRRG